MALSTGCVRARSWRSKAGEPRLPSCEVPVTPLPALPSILGGSRLPTLRLGVRCTSPASCLPPKKPAPYQGQGAFPRQFAGALAAQGTHAPGTSFVGFGAHFGRLSPSATFPSAISRIASEYHTMKSRIHFAWFGPPAHNPFGLKDTHSELLPLVWIPNLDSFLPCGLSASRPAARFTGRPGSPEPVDELTIPGPLESRKLILGISYFDLKRSNSTARIGRHGRGGVP